MPDFHQNELITTIHDLRRGELDRLDERLHVAAAQSHIGLILPVTAADMRAAPFQQIVAELADTSYVDTIVVALGVAPDQSDYEEALNTTAPLGPRASVLWTDGPKVQAIYSELVEGGISLATPGKGRSVWTAVGYLLADPAIDTFVVHDCDIHDYDRGLLARLCFPMVHQALDFEFCKAYYARVTDQLHGRVVRLLVTPLLRVLSRVFPANEFIRFLSCFRYPLSGEFSMSRNLARTNRMAGNWGLEIGTLAEVYRNTSLKRVCQVDLCRLYEHKHRPLSRHDETSGLMRMAIDIVTTIFRTLASQGVVMGDATFVTIRSSYLRTAQDCIRHYAADALVNDLEYDRHSEEAIAGAFAEAVVRASELFRDEPAEATIPNWTRVHAAYPTLTSRLRDSAGR